MGKDAYVMKNPLWKINENGKDYLLMYCEKDTICKLCETSYKKIADFELLHNNGEKLTFGKGANGYILTHLNNSGISMHQIITGCYGNGKGTKNVSVDHIDQNPLNNTLDNLRIATREEQEQNSLKEYKCGCKIIQYQKHHQKHSYCFKHLHYLKTKHILDDELTKINIELSSITKKENEL